MLFLYHQKTKQGASREGKNMTIEEATIYIKEWLKDEYLDCKDRAALTAIIKESEQEACGKDINVPATDAISRKRELRWR